MRRGFCIFGFEVRVRDTGCVRVRGTAWKRKRIGIIGATDFRRDRVKLHGC